MRNQNLIFDKIKIAVVVCSQCISTQSLAGEAEDAQAAATHSSTQVGTADLNRTAAQGVDLTNSASGLKERAGSAGIANAMASAGLTTTGGIFLTKGMTIQTAGHAQVVTGEAMPLATGKPVVAKGWFEVHQGLTWSVAGGVLTALGIVAGKQAARDYGAASNAWKSELDSTCATDLACLRAGGGAPEQFITGPGNPFIPTEPLGQLYKPLGYEGGVPPFPANPKDPVMRELTSKMIKLNSDLKALAKEGFSYDPATGNIKTPKGSINPASLGSDAGMAAAGVSPEMLDKIKKELNNANIAGQKVIERLKAQGIGADGDGGGGEAIADLGPEGNPRDPRFDPNKYLAAMMAKKNNANAAARGVAGLSRQMGDGVIGVAGDNLFEMVKRRYESKRKEGIFISSPSVR